MSKISIKDVEYVASLAQLELDEAARERLVQEMGEILAYMDKLNELDTTNVEPMMHAMEMTNVFREDILKDSIPHEVALQNAPVHDGQYFIVPRILEGDEA